MDPKVSGDGRVIRESTVLLQAWGPLDGFGTPTDSLSPSATCSTHLSQDLSTNSDRMDEPTPAPCQVTQLCLAAVQAREFSYSPYSKFRVGAALLTENGEIVSGCNIENAAYSPGSCAERTAFVKAISDGKKRFKALAISSDIEAPCPPCGVCRQVAREFCHLEMPIYLVNASFKSAEEFPTKVMKTTLDISNLEITGMKSLDYCVHVWCQKFSRQSFYDDIRNRKIAIPLPMLY
ncbi:hypothetical protein O181_025721 [Austropuccinia psidii MF-1]|uniref:cytidine deaminase n=1 Tax=Austropuccinia psidii MF-1 TaxID=1389203 RepID=A0A9Q3CP02_9BASI|nr:hypothetical protein [Austropuccinia psidii MF-1]